MLLINETDIRASDLGALHIGQLRRRRAPNIDLAIVGALQKPSDMQQRRLARTGRRHQRYRLPGPQRELRAVEDGQRRSTLRVLALDLVEIDNRYIFRPLPHRALTHTGAHRRDRGARHARTDRAWRERTASAP